MAYVELPFSLPCHLAISSYRRATGSHSTGNAIDLSPLIQGVDEKTKTAIYLKTYLILWAHLSRNRLRINIAKNNRHFHFEYNINIWEFGFEQFESRLITVMQNGKPVKKYTEVQIGEIVNYDATSVGANLKFSGMLKAIENLWLGIFPSIAGTIQGFLQTIKEVNLPEYSPARVYFEENLISKSDAKRFIDEFSEKVMWMPSNFYIPWKPQDMEDFTSSIGNAFGLLKVVAIIGGTFYLIRKLDKNDK